MKGTFSKTTGTLEPQHQNVQCHIRTLVGEGLTILKRCSRCILKPQSTELPTLVRSHVGLHRKFSQMSQPLRSPAVPCMAKSFILGWFARWEVSSCTTAGLCGAASRISLKQHYCVFIIQPFFSGHLVNLSMVQVYISNSY